MQWGRTIKTLQETFARWVDWLMTQAKLDLALIKLMMVKSRSHQEGRSIGKTVKLRVWAFHQVIALKIQLDQVATMEMWSFTNLMSDTYRDKVCKRCVTKSPNSQAHQSEATIKKLNLKMKTRMLVQAQAAMSPKIRLSRRELDPTVYNFSVLASRDSQMRAMTVASVQDSIARETRWAASIIVCWG